MNQVLEDGHRPECVFAVTDMMAVGAMAALRDHGLHPGRDVAVAGFDDIELLQDVQPSLTTVALPLTVIGETLLRVALDGEDADVIRGQVRLRESTPTLNGTALRG
jgi:LacI family transcriptional regulator